MMLTTSIFTALALALIGPLCVLAQERSVTVLQTTLITVTSKLPPPHKTSLRKLIICPACNATISEKCLGLLYFRDVSLSLSPPYCERDNCLGCVLPSYADIPSFCKTFTVSECTSFSLPPDVLASCTSLPQRVSSACSCIDGKTLTPTSSLTQETTSCVVPYDTRCKAKDCLICLEEAKVSGSEFCATFTTAVCTLYGLEQSSNIPLSLLFVYFRYFIGLHMHYGPFAFRTSVLNTFNDFGSSAW